MRAHANEIDWRFNGRSFTKSGCGQAKSFATLRAPNNTSPPFQNPGSTTDSYSHFMLTAECIYIQDASEFKHITSLSYQQEASSEHQCSHEGWAEARAGGNPQECGGGQETAYSGTESLAHMQLVVNQACLLSWHMTLLILTKVTVFPPWKGKEDREKSAILDIVYGIFCKIPKIMRNWFA